MPLYVGTIAHAHGIATYTTVFRYTYIGTVEIRISGFSRGGGHVTTTAHSV